MRKISHAFWRLLYRFHRYAGLLVALIAIMLAITGIALNHTQDLQLDKRFIRNGAILNWYGISTPDDIKAYPTKNHWLSRVESQLFFDDLAVLKTSQALIGAVETDQFMLVALADSLVMLSLEGEIVEKIPFSNVDKVGVDEQDVVYLQQESVVVKSDDGLLSWQTVKQPAVTWSSQAEMPAKLVITVQQHFAGSILPLERVLLDVHSGRFFGKAGVFIVDLSAVLLVLLAISGSVIWIKHRLRRRFHRLSRK